MYALAYRTLRFLNPREWTTRRFSREMARTQWLSGPELEAWQLIRLRQLVAHAYENVPFYRQRFQALDIHPQDIHSRQDFEALPFLTKEDVVSNALALRSLRPHGRLYSNETGGSTGQPVRFVVEDSFWRWNVALRDRARLWYGVHPGDKMALVWGAPRDMPDWNPKRRWRARIMRHRVLNAFSMTEDKMRAFAEMLVRWQPAIFKAYPSALTLLAEFIQARGIAGIHPRLIETTAEKVTGPQRQLLEQVFGCPVADCYSSRELGTIGYQCPTGGLHICETRYLEIVADGQVVEPGQLGEVVITSLHQFAMPFIRYKIGDMGLSRAENCACGRGLPMLHEVVGRTHDYLTTAGGQFVHGEFFAYTFRVRPQVARYQVYQPDKEHLQVRLVCHQPVDQTWLAGVRAEIQNRFGPETHVDLEVVDHIPLTAAGKHRYITSEVRPDFL